VAIDYRALRSVTARELVGALLHNGFELDRQGGAHQLYYHPADRRRVTISHHRPGQTFKVKTLRTTIERQAKWGEDDLRRLGLLP
jgi:predicted RNA binding protein YcfA (HicA-like mRNA interferase family)